MNPVPVVRYLRVALGLWVFGLWGASFAQTLDNPDFRALPRPIHFSTSLHPAGGPPAVIVYGREAPWTRAAAEAVQKAVRDWLGVTLALVDDRTVTSEETWLPSGAYVRRPLIVLGNCQDNRVLHALGTRYLEQSNRYWPGGDRFLLRTVFEPFIADVNWIVLSASTDAGLQAAVACFVEQLEGLPRAGGVIPRLRIHGGGKDAWQPNRGAWTVPAGYAAASNESVSAIAMRAAANAPPPPTAGEPLASVIGTVAIAYGAGGPLTMLPELPDNETTLRSLAAYILNACRGAGGRTHIPFHHYGGMAVIGALRGIMQADILSAEEFTEMESLLTLSGAYPNEYIYDHLGSDSGFINLGGGRHCMACLMITTHTLDYVRHHCRMDDKTRQEIERRAEGVRKATARYIHSFRDNVDTWELGESTMMAFYAMLHQGFPDVIRNGTLRRMADMYLLTSDNLRDPLWGFIGRYAGLDSYIGAGPGMLAASWHGRGLVAAAAFYYDDPQFRWFVHDSQRVGGIHGNFGSVATSFLRMHWDPSVPAADPERLFGARALPFDPRLYALAAHPDRSHRWSQRRGLRVPAPIERLVDRATLRDGIGADDAYLFFATSQRVVPSGAGPPLHNNSIARYTDLGEIWLYHNSMFNTGWARNLVSISNGRNFVPAVGCTLEALANLGDLSVLAAREPGVGGTDWTRAIVHWRGHYFAVLDTVHALTNGEFNLVCRWRSPNPAELEKDAWVARAGSATLRIATPERLPQIAEQWESDGPARPYVLTQYKHVSLAKGEAETFLNLISVAGTNRPDEFAVRRLGATAMLVRGRTAEGAHLAAVGSGALPLPDFETDAAFWYVAGNTLCLVQATRLDVRSGAVSSAVYRAEAPVNLRLDCATGEGLVEESPLGRPDFLSAAQPLQVDAARLPSPEAALEQLWEAASDSGPVAEPPAPSELFKAIPADAALERPLRKIRSFTIQSTPAANRDLRELTDGQYVAHLSGNMPTWRQTQDLTVTLDFGRPVRVAHLRLVSTLKPASLGPGFNLGQCSSNDFSFGLALSNDGFSKDVRVVEEPRVRFEETALYPIWHYALGRLPTYVIEVGAEARSIRLTPRAVGPEVNGLFLCEVEVLADEPAPEFGVQALAADVDGDGDNELVVGSGNQELAVFRSDGRRLWSRELGADVFTFGAADLDADGRSEILVYTTREELRRFNGDGSERPVGDIHAAYVRKEGWCGFGGMVAMAAWAPDSETNQVVMLWSEGGAHVLADGSVETLKSRHPRGAGRLVNLWPDEPEVLGTVGFTANFLSRRRDQEGNYIQLAERKVTGEGGAPCMRGFGWVQAVDEPGRRGVLAANNGGLNYWPIAALVTNGEDGVWGFDTSGVPNVAALLETNRPSGQARVFLARQDGFVNVFDLEGESIGLLNAEGPILGLALLGEEGTDRRIAVGTKFGVHLFGPDLKKIGSLPIRVAAFAGPAGKQRDRVYVVAPSGQVTVLALR